MIISRNRKWKSPVSFRSGLGNWHSITPPNSINQAIREPIFKGRGLRTSNLAVESSKKCGEHGITLADSTARDSIHYTELFGCIKISTFIELLSFSFDLFKYPQLGWYLNNSGIFPFLASSSPPYLYLSFPDPSGKGSFSLELFYLNTG